MVVKDGGGGCIFPWESSLQEPVWKFFLTLLEREIHLISDLSGPKIVKFKGPLKFL